LLSSLFCLNETNRDINNTQEITRDQVIGGRFTQEYAVYTYTGITRPQQDFSKQSKAHLYA